MAALRMAQGIEARRRLREAGKQGALGEREIGERFLEIEARGLGGTGAQVAVIEAVEVGGEDPGLGPAHFQTPGGERFMDFRERRAFRRRGGDFDELLGDGRGPGNNPPVR